MTLACLTLLRILIVNYLPDDALPGSQAHYFHFGHYLLQERIPIPSGALEQ